MTIHLRKKWDIDGVFLSRGSADLKEGVPFGLHL